MAGTSIPPIQCNEGKNTGVWHAIRVQWVNAVAGCRTAFLNKRYQWLQGNASTHKGNRPSAASHAQRCVFNRRQSGKWHVT